MSPERAALGCRPPSRREWALAFLLLGLAVTLFLGPALLTGRYLSAADILLDYPPWNAARPADWHGPANGLLSDSALQFEPWLAYTAARLHAGALPLWNPDNMLGAPFIGNMQSAVFYPPNWPAFLWPGPEALALRAWLKLLAAALGMYGLARHVARVGPLGALVAAFAFTFCSFLTGWLLYPLTGAVVWLPALWWAVAALVARPSGRPLAAVAAVVGLTLLAGQPEMAFHMAVATAFLAVFLLTQARGGGLAWLRRLGWLAGAVTLGVALAAVQLAPFLEYLVHSAALQSRAAANAPNNFWLPFYFAWTMISPDLFGNPAHGDWWATWGNYSEANSYAGVLPLLLAPLAALAPLRAQRRLTGFLAALIAVCVAVVYHAPLVFEAVTALPGFQTAANQRLIAVIMFAVALLGGIGADALGRASWRRAAGGVLLCGLALAVGGLGAPWLLARGYFALPDAPGPVAAWQAAVLRGVVALGLALAATMGYVLARRAPPRVRILAGAALPLLLLADLLQAHIGYNPAIPAAQYFPPAPATTYLGAQAGLGRVAATGWQLMPNTNLVYGLADLRGYDAVTPQTYHDLALALDPTIPQGPGGGFRPLDAVQSPLLNLLNGRYLLTAPGEDPNVVFDLRQEGARDDVVSAITGAFRPGQTFIAGHDNLSEVQVFGATFGRRPGGRLVFHLKSAPRDAADLATVSVDAATLGDDSWWTFRFPPVAGSAGRPFYFSLDAPGVRDDQAVTVYYTRRDIYRAGTRLENDRPANGDLVFRTRAALDPADPPFARVLDGGAGGASVYENRRALPRAWLVHQAEAVPDTAARLRRLAAPGFDPRALALLDAPLPTADAVLGSAAGDEKVDITLYQPERVEIAATAVAPGLLILADQDFPGWTATVDGAAAPIRTVDHALRAVYLPAGSHLIRFTYAPLAFRAGAVLSLGALVALAGLLAWLRRRA